MHLQIFKRRVFDCTKMEYSKKKKSGRVSKIQFTERKIDYTEGFLKGKGKLIMENASKALIMAAEILLGIILITIAVLGYTSWSEFSKNIHTNIENRNIQQFNTKFYNIVERKRFDST